ncbi:unnamed protein product [Pedinophyceae sp. YPF-701]|nr:unnamed protein product [Pedinophyceae sp. YPF-701]
MSNWIGAVVKQLAITTLCISYLKREGVISVSPRAIPNRTARELFEFAAPAQRPPGSGGAARRKTRAPRRGLGIDVTPTSTPSGSPELSGAPARDISPTSAARPPPPLPAWDLLPSPAGREGGAAAATWAEPPTHEGAPMVEALVMVREVYVNRKLAQKWADGLPWARCDWSGTELDQESRERYDAMWPDLIAEARSLLGADLSELMAACDAEWAKVKGERIAAFERAQRGARPGTEALRAPRGILKKSNRRAKERKARRVGFVESPEVSS